MTYSLDILRATLSDVPPARRYIVAYSGGCDSQVLLHSLAQLRLPDIDLLAVHIDHGLYAASAEWAARCVAWANDLGVACQVIKVSARHKAGESPEEAARKARYQALYSVLETGDVLLTGHHCDDQAETLLLQLLRGSGPLGLSAMGRITPLARGFLVRPFLEIAQAELKCYANKQGLVWIDDPSNQSIVYDRNFLRHRVVPNLAERWPSWQRIIARVASHQSEMVQLSDDLASLDLHTTVHPTEKRLYVDRVLQLPDYRQRNLLRYWIRQLGLPLPSTRQLLHVQRDVLHADAQCTPVVRWPGVEVRRYRNDLYAMPPLSHHDAHSQVVWHTRTETCVKTPTGRIDVQDLLDMGFVRRKLDCMPLLIRYRCSGERIRLKKGGMHRDLKKLFQQAGVPPWLRDRIPLVFQGDNLLAVLGYWRCDDC